MVKWTELVSERETKPNALFLCAPILDYRACLDTAIRLAEASQDRSMPTDISIPCYPLLTLQLRYLVTAYPSFCLVLNRSGVLREQCM